MQNKAEISCLHCGLPVPLSRQEDAEKLFCCTGCEFVYSTIQGLGLKEFYQYRDALAGKMQPAAPKGLSYSHFDTEEFIEKYGEKNGSQLSIKLSAEGVHCAGCVWLVEKLPGVIGGLLESRLNFATGEVFLRCDTDRVSLSHVARTLDSLGYPVHPAGEHRGSTNEVKEDRRFLLRVAVAGLCTANIMMLAVSLYQGEISGIEDKYASYLRWVSLLLSLPAVFYSAFPFYRGAFGAILLKELNIDLPIAIALVAGFVVSAFNTLAGRPQVYFDSLSALIFLLLTGRYLQRMATRRAARDARLSWSIVPAFARIREQGGLHEIPVDALREGLTVEVRAGERFPADGSVTHGESSVDCAVLTGESVPRDVAPGSKVFAGALNLSGLLSVKVEGAGERSRIGKMLKNLSLAGKRAPIISFTSAVSRYFIAVVIALAAGTFLYWLPSGLLTAMDNAVALLVVTCPCALGLATPVAFSVAMGRAARRGILIKSEDALERISRVKHVYFDKTGTLTEGELKIVKRAFFNAEPQAVMHLAGAMASCASTHPVSAAFIKASTGKPDADFPVRYHHGRGLEGEKDGEKLKLGSLSWLMSCGVTTVNDCHKNLSEWQKEAYTIVAFSRGEKIEALFGLQDTASRGAKEYIEKICGTENAYILSGDNSLVVEKTASECGIDHSHARGNLFPEDKERIVKGDKSFNAMVGDGVNDLSAMRAAGIAVGMHGGAWSNLESADIFISSGRLKELNNLFAGSRHTMHVIRRNLAFSLVYNVIGGAAAICGMINPLTAAVLMPLSSLTVIASSVYTRAFREE